MGQAAWDPRQPGPASAFATAAIALLARLMPIRGRGYEAGASVASRSSRTEGTIISRPVVAPACGKIASAHSHRRTAQRASPNVNPDLPGHATAPVRFDSGNAWNRRATTEYRPNRHGAARRTVARHHPRVDSRPRHERSSWKVVSIFQRAV